MSDARPTVAGSDRRTIYEKSCCGRTAYSLPACDVPEAPLAELIPEHLRRSEPPRLPEISEIDLLRHFTGLSTLNFGVESGSYPLGSCTSDSGWYGCRPLSPSSRAATSFALGLYFMVHEPSG